MIDKVMPYVDQFGTKFGESLGKGIQYISSMMPAFTSGIQSMMPTFQLLIAGAQQVLPSIIALGSTIASTVQNIVVQATPVVAQIIQTIGQVIPVLEPIFSMIISTVGEIVSTVLPPLGTAIQMIGDAIVVLAPIVTTAFGVISECVTTAVGGISSVISGALGLISSIWSGSWQGMVDSFGTIFGGIAQICKAPINAVIGIINGCIDAINSISVDIPDWVPMVGGSHFGMSLSHIPKLATGGVVNKATTAVIGEAGKEAVMPLERNTGWIGQLSSQIMSHMQGMTVAVPNVTNQIPNTNGDNPPPPSVGGNKNITINLNINKLADQVVANDEDDVDEIAEKVAEKILEELDNI